MYEEKKENKNDNKKTIIISIAIVVLFIISIFTLSYAFFTAQTNIDNNESAGFDVTTKNLNTSLEQEGSLNLTIIPGEVFAKTFTVTNNGDTIRFKIGISDLENNFNEPDDITYTIKCGDTEIKGKTVFPNEKDATGKVYGRFTNESVCFILHKF